MQVLPRWRNVLILKNSLIQTTKIVASSQSPNLHLASFHSTSIFSEKWKNKWNSEFTGSQQPTKNESSAINERWDVVQDDHAEKKSKFKSADHRRSCFRRKMRKMKKQSLYKDYDEGPERVFRVSDLEDIFTLREETDWSERWHCRWKKQTGTIVYTERITLGLPLKGPLKIEDVKNAFRASALKWHPDKNQGPSQAVAVEKFISCVTAYKSLCNALSLKPKPPVSLI